MRDARPEGVVVSAVDFVPSQLWVNEPLPFIATFEKAEAEVAAAFIVVALARLGDEWRGIQPREIGQAVADGPTASWMSNPFCRPDFWKLVDFGFAEFEGEDGTKGRPIRFTDAGLEALRKWAR